MSLFNTTMMSGEEFHKTMGLPSFRICISFRSERELVDLPRFGAKFMKSPRYAHATAMEIFKGMTEKKHFVSVVFDPE